MREFDSAIDMMDKMGGSFVSALAECYIRADAGNKSRLRGAFPEYFARYEKMYAEHQAAKAKEEK